MLNFSLSSVFFGMGWPCYVMLQPKSDVFQRFFGTICVRRKSSFPFFVDGKTLSSNNVSYCSTP